jgi:hypothetical protein
MRSTRIKVVVIAREEVFDPDAVEKRLCDDRAGPPGGASGRTPIAILAGRMQREAGASTRRCRRGARAAAGTFRRKRVRRGGQPRNVVMARARPRSVKLLVAWRPLWR